MGLEHIPAELKAQKAWVCAWDGSKCPMRPRERLAASSTDPDTWDDFEAAEEAVRLGCYDYTGYVFHDCGIVGIDIDCGFDADGLLSAVGRDIVSACRSYTEKSRSGRGVHIILKGSLPFPGRNNKHGVEAYRTERYFIMTGRQLLFGEIIENQEAIDYIVGKYFPEADSKEPLSLKGFAKHLAEHGKLVDYPMAVLVLQNIVACMKEMAIQGQPVKLENAEACVPPLPLREVEQIVSRITKYRR